MRESRQIRVYIAAPFFDMQVERRHLATVIVPQLRLRCEERGIAFDMIDLRSEATGERDASARVLAGFVYQIDHCRPYFIGLLGDRSGEMPIAVHEDVLSKETWLRDEVVSGRSVVALEFLHGALRNPRAASNAFFYFRDPAYSQLLPESMGSAGQDEAVKVSNLKAAVRNSGLPVRENYHNPEALGEFVLADLTRAIDTYISEAPKTTQLTPQQLERLLAASCGPAEPAASQEPDPGDSAPTATPSPARASETPPTVTGRRIRIVHLSGSRARTTQEFSLDSQDEVWIGRDPVSHVRYAEGDQSVSRAHLKIVTSFADPNAYILVARGRNGTLINNTEVLGSVGLQDGDIVQVGRGGPAFRFEQFPKMAAQEGWQEPELPPIAAAAHPQDEPGRKSSATTVLSYDPAIAKALLEASKNPKSAAPLIADVTNRIVPVPLNSEPLTSSPRFRLVSVTLVVLAVCLFVVWMVWKR